MELSGVIAGFEVAGRLATFGTAGVRGVFNKTQRLDEVYRLIQTTCFVLGKGRYGIGWDGRKTSSLLARAAASAVLSNGSEAFVFGMIPTPVVAFGARQRRSLAGFSVTASHNPPEFSGVKFYDGKGMEFDEEIERRIETAMVVNSWKSTNNVGSIVKSDEVLDEYIDALLGRFAQTKRQLKIVVDCANGPGGLVTPYVLSKLGHKVIPLNSQISWRFPGRQPEPTISNLKETCDLVRECGAHIGFAHDGDADRLVMINSSGAVVPDSVTAILMLRSLNRSGPVILSENTSSAVEEEAQGRSMVVVRAKIGKTFTQIENNNAVLATEPSKFVDPKWGMWEDGIYAAACISDLVSSASPSVLTLMSQGTNWQYRQVNLQVSVDLVKLSERVDEVFGKYRIVEKRQQFGLKLVFKDGSWIMFRPSGTEPKTRIYCESRDEMRLEELLQDGVRYVQGLARFRERTSQ